MKRPSAPILALALLATAASANPQLPDLNSSRGGSGSISRTCQRILRQPVAGCTEPEFATGRCSRGCADALESTQASIQDACDGVAGGPPFLTAALEDRLVDMACRRGVEDDDEDEDEEERPTTTGERERGAPETNAPTPTPTAAGGGGQETPDARPTERPEERSGGDEERPNGVGGSPFDIVAGGGAGLRVEAGWMALGLGVLFLAR